MKAVLCKAFGGPETLVVEEIEEPSPGPGEVVIDVHAAALNFFDTLVIRNKYQYKPPMPFSPSAEVAGTVASLGPGVDEFEVGDRVLALVRWNGCRERTVSPVSAVVRIPDSVSDVIASGVSVTYGTAIHGLKDRANLQPGEVLVVLGASGGAGLAAVEIGALMGAHVIAVASSPDKLDLCLEHGASAGIDYDEADLKDSIKSLSDGRGADVVYDCVGGDLTEPTLRATAWEGRYLVVGFAAGNIPRPPLNLVLLKGCSMVGVFWGAWAERHPELQRANIEQVLAWCAGGSLTPHIHGTFPLERTDEALALIDRRQATGKVVICP